MAHKTQGLWFTCWNFSLLTSLFQMILQNQPLKSQSFTSMKRMKLSSCFEVCFNTFLIGMRTGRSWLKFLGPRAERAEILPRKKQGLRGKNQHFLQNYHKSYFS